MAEQFPKKDNGAKSEADSENVKGRLDVDEGQSLRRVLLVNCLPTVLVNHGALRHQVPLLNEA